MSNIKFENCNFINSTIHVGDNNYGSGPGSVSDAMGLGVALIGGAIAFPSLLTTILPLCIMGAKTLLLGTTVYCGSKAFGTIVSSIGTTEGVKELEEPKNRGYIGDNNYIELEPISVRDSE